MWDIEAGKSKKGVATANRLASVPQAIFTESLGSDDRKHDIVAMFVKLKNKLDPVQLVCDTKIDCGG